MQHLRRFQQCCYFVIGQEKATKLKADFYDQSQTTHLCVEIYGNACDNSIIIQLGKMVYIL